MGGTRGFHEPGLEVLYITSIYILLTITQSHDPTEMQTGWELESLAQQLCKFIITVCPGPATAYTIKELTCLRSFVLVCISPENTLLDKTFQIFYLVK